MQAELKRCLETSDVQLVFVMKKGFGVVPVTTAPQQPSPSSVVSGLPAVSTSPVLVTTATPPSKQRSLCMRMELFIGEPLWRTLTPAQKGQLQQLASLAELDMFGVVSKWNAAVQPSVRGSAMYCFVNTRDCYARELLVEEARLQLPSGRFCARKRKHTTPYIDSSAATRNDVSCCTLSYDTGYYFKPGESTFKYKKWLAQQTMIPTYPAAQATLEVVPPNTVIPGTAGETSSELANELPQVFGDPVGVTSYEGLFSQAEIVALEVSAARSNGCIRAQLAGEMCSMR